MNPARNLYRVDMLDVSHHSPMMRALHHPSYVFEKKLSHTADSQDQRHRMVPASRPLMTFADTPAPDVVTPRLIRENPALRGVPQAIDEAWTAKNRLLASACRWSTRSTCCPTPRRCAWSSRAPHRPAAQVDAPTCFNAQEEIYLASMDEDRPGAGLHPRLGQFLGPPCVLRNRWCRRAAPRARTSAVCRCGTASRRRCGACSRRAGRASLPTMNTAAGVAWIAHLYTALGAGTALAATLAASPARFRAAFLWLAVAVFIDCDRRRARPLGAR